MIIFQWNRKCRSHDLQTAERRFRYIREIMSIISFKIIG
ncbi:hypothetical protein [Paenibacillus sp. CF384]